MHPKEGIIIYIFIFDFCGLYRKRRRLIGMSSKTQGGGVEKVGEPEEGELVEAKDVPQEESAEKSQSVSVPVSSAASGLISIHINVTHLYSISCVFL